METGTGAGFVSRTSTTGWYRAVLCTGKAPRSVTLFDWISKSKATTGVSGQAECGRHLDERAEEDGDPVEEAFTQTSCMYREGELGDPILCMAPTGSAFSSRSPTEVCRDFDDMYADSASFIPSEPVDVCPESHLGACVIHPGRPRPSMVLYVSGGEAVCASRRILVHALNRTIQRESPTRSRAFLLGHSPYLWRKVIRPLVKSYD